MKRLAFLLAALIPVCTWAGIEAVSLYIETVGASSTHSVPGITGELLATEIDVTGTASVAIATSANIGSSISGAKTIQAAGLITNAVSVLHTNGSYGSSGIYLYNDTVTLTATSNVAYSESVKVLLILDTK